jgi:putative effector of murein hydrolase
LVLQDGFIALRVANGLQIGLLFFVGYWWTHYSGGNRWLIGVAIALLGTALVLLAVPLGG